MHNTKILLSFFALLAIAGCGVGEREITIQNCGEPIEITDCKWKGQLFTCLIENKTDATFAGVPIWRYDENGVLLEKAPYRYAAGLKSGGKTRQKLPVTKYGKDNTAKIVFCRVDPEKRLTGSDNSSL